jgi:hypothetical protein
MLMEPFRANDGKLTKIDPVAANHLQANGCRAKDICPLVPQYPS